MNTQQCDHKRDPQFMGHPGGLGILATGNFFNSFAWGGVYAILIYYLYTPYTRGLGFTQGQAASMIAAMGACNSMFTIVGSWLADRVFGARKAIIIGDIVKGIAFLLLAVPVVNLQQGRFFAILALILMSLPIMGASNASLTGQLYEHDENAKRDAAFTIHAIANNLGGFIAPITIGFIGMHSYHLGFFISALFAFAYGAMVLFFGKRYFKSLGEKPQRPIEKNKLIKIAIYFCVIVSSLLTIVVMVMSKGWFDVDDILYGIAGISFMIPIVFLWRIQRNASLTKKERQRLKPFNYMFALQVLVSLSAVFVTTGLAVFIESKIDLHIFGIDVAPATFTSIAAFMSIFISAFFVWFWSLKKHKNIKSTSKYRAGMFCMAFAYTLLSIPILTLSQSRFSSLWILVYFLFLGISQNLMDPIGASLTARLAPVSYEAQLQSAWLQSNSIANGIAICVFQYLKTAQSQMMLFPIMALMLFAGVLVLTLLRKHLDELLKV